jgi:hypothetical protein
MTWIANNLVLCGILSIVLCFMLYLGSRLISAGWYKSKASYLPGKHLKNGGKQDEE